MRTYRVHVIARDSRTGKEVRFSHHVVTGRPGEDACVSERSRERMAVRQVAATRPYLTDIRADGSVGI